MLLQHDDVGDKEIQEVVDAFPGQTIDFFGALRARVYDDRVREFVKDTGMENIVIAPLTVIDAFPAQFLHVLKCRCAVMTICDATSFPAIQLLQAHN